MQEGADCGAWGCVLPSGLNTVFKTSCFAVLCRAVLWLQELRRQDPALLQQIQANQGEFMRMVMEPQEGGEGDDMAELLQAMAGGAGGAGGLPPGMVQVGGFH